MEIVVVLLVLMIAAFIVITLMADQTDLFGDFANDTGTDAKCGLWEAQYERRFCSGDVQGGSGSTLDQKITDRCGYSVSCNDGEVVRN